MSHPAARRDQQDSGDAPTVLLRVHRPGSLGTTHARQVQWHTVVRVLWWMFLLPVAVFAWSSWRLRGMARGVGYVAASFVLLFGVLVFSAVVAGPPPATVADSAPLSVSAAPATTEAPASPAPVIPPPAPIAVPQVVVAPPRSPAARPTVRPATPRTAYTAPAAPRRTATVPAGGGNVPGSTYTNVDGNQVQRPVAAAAQPAGASAKCEDGTWSFSQHKSGTCSGHGGVASWV